MNIAATGLRRLGVDLHCEYLGNLRSVPNLIKARKRLRQLAEAFDVVHAQYGSACSLVTAAITGIPKVLSIRGNDWNVHNDSIGFYYFHTRLARAMTRWSIGSFDCVVTVSNRVAADIRRYYPAQRLEPLPSPLDLTRFVPRDKNEARAQQGFPDCDEKWVLFNALNIYDPIKRFDLAQEAFNIAAAKLGNLRFRVATNLPHDILPLFASACDVILCTSETEGWPNCVKEALACNVPFVATDVSDLKEIAAKDRTCRVCPSDPEILAENICDVLTCGERPEVRKHVEEMSLDRSSQRLLKIYESVIRSSTSKAANLEK